MANTETEIYVGQSLKTVHELGDDPEYSPAFLHIQIVDDLIFRPSSCSFHSAVRCRAERDPLERADHGIVGPGHPLSMKIPAVGNTSLTQFVNGRDTPRPRPDLSVLCGEIFLHT
jgi:hypothetical protein